MAVGLVISFLFSQTPVMKGLANGFFKAIEYQKYDTAYFFMSSEFKKQNKLNDFKLMLQETRLYTAKQWRAVEHEDNKRKKEGWIRGFVTITVDEKDKRIPIEIYGKLEDKDFLSTSWKIASIVLPEQEE